MQTNYDDIIQLPHHQSKRRPHMTIDERAAQFSPFAALTGYGDAIDETARLTEDRPDLDEHAREGLDLALNQLRFELEQEQPTVRIRRFLEDDRKEGGSYEELRGRVRQIDSYRGVLRLEDGGEIPVEDIVELEVESHYE